MKRREWPSECTRQMHHALDGEMGKCGFCKKKREEQSSWFIKLIKGLYYLSFAKWFNPVAHELAWLAVEKLYHQHHVQSQLLEEVLPNGVCTCQTKSVDAASECP